MFKIVDGRLHSGVLTAHSSKRFTLFAFPISLAEAALFGQDVVNKQFIKADAVRRAVEAAIKTRSAEIRKQFLRDFDYRYGEVDVTAGPHNFVMQYELVGIFNDADWNTQFHWATCLAFRDPPRVRLKDGGNCSPRYAARSYCLIMSAAFPSSAIRMASIGLYPSSAIESR